MLKVFRVGREVITEGIIDLITKTSNNNFKHEIKLLEI